MSIEIKTRITPHFTLYFDPEDGTPKEQWKNWKLCPTYKAIAKIEEAIGLDLKRHESWPLPSKHFPAVVWGLLEKFNPEVTQDEVIGFLNPEIQIPLSNEIFYLMFPGVKEALEKQKESGATASPNAPMGTPTV